MFVRVEVAVRPEFQDPKAEHFLRKIELARPKLREKIRWARFLDVYWLDVGASREETIPAITEIFYDPVLNWLFTGDLIPSTSGRHGGVMDLFEAAPHRSGNFWGIERRFRTGVTDNVGKTTKEAIEIVLQRPSLEVQASTGSLFLLEGPEIKDDDLEWIATEVISNELIQSWTVLPSSELRLNERFHPESVQLSFRRRSKVGKMKPKGFDLSQMDDEALTRMSKQNLWALNLNEMKAIQQYFSNSKVKAFRRNKGLTEFPTDVEMEILAQTWSEHCKHKIFNAKISYQEKGSLEAPVEPKIPAEIDSLFKTTIAGTTKRLRKPWLLSVFSDNAGIISFDDQDAVCIKVETHNSPSALDPYGGALTGIVGVNRDILGCGRGAKPIFNTDVFWLPRIESSRESVQA